jgi:hypothetical protein
MKDFALAVNLQPRGDLWYRDRPLFFEVLQWQKTALAQRLWNEDTIQS